MRLYFNYTKMKLRHPPFILTPYSRSAFGISLRVPNTRMQGVMKDFPLFMVVGKDIGLLSTTDIFSVLKSHFFLVIEFSVKKNMWLQRTFRWLLGF